jgi:hypothetical protein
MALRGKVNDGPRPMAFQNIANELPIADIAVHEGVSRIPGEAIQVSQVSRISELVEGNNFSGLASKPVQDKIRPNKPRSACNKYFVRQFQTFHPSLYRLLAW